MRAYQHILLTTDLSEFSKKVAEKAINLAGHYNAKVTCLYVVVAAEDSGDLTALIEDGRQKLNDFVKASPSIKTIPLVSLSSSTIESEITKVASALKIDLIVVGRPTKSLGQGLPMLDIKAIEEDVLSDLLVVNV